MSSSSSVAQMLDYVERHAPHRLYPGIERPELRRIYVELLRTSEDPNRFSIFSNNSAAAAAAQAAAPPSPSSAPATTTAFSGGIGGVPSIEQMRKILRCSSRVDATKIDIMPWYDVKHLYEEKILKSRGVEVIDEEDDDDDHHHQHQQEEDFSRFRSASNSSPFLDFHRRESSFDFFAVADNGQVFKAKREEAAESAESATTADSSQVHPAMTRVSLLHRIVSFESRSIGRVCALATLSQDWQDALQNYDSALWRDIVKNKQLQYKQNKQHSKVFARFGEEEDGEAPRKGAPSSMFRAGLALRFAAEQGVGWLVARLLSAGLDPDTLPAAKIKDVRSALHFACLNRNAAIAQFLLQCGASVTAADQNGLQPLMLLLSGTRGTVRNSKLAREMQILKQQQQQQQQQQPGDNDDENFFASKDDESAKRLIFSLFFSERRLSDDSLVANSLDVNATDSDGKSLLHYVVSGFAREENVVAALAALVSLGADCGGSPLRFGQEQQSRALRVVAERGFAQAVRVLFGAGAGRNNNNVCALTAASRSGHVEVVRALCESHPTRQSFVNSVDPHTGETALHAASAANKSGVVRLLLRELGANVELENGAGLHVVHVAASVKCLPPSLRDDDDDDEAEETSATTADALHEILAFIREDPQSRVPNAGGVINDFVFSKTRDSQQSTALHLASSLLNFDAVAALVQLGTNTIKWDASGFTPLHLVCRAADRSDAESTGDIDVDTENAIAVAELLLSRTTADPAEVVNAQQQQQQSSSSSAAGRTPLWFAAVEAGCLPLVQFLVQKKGADVRLGPTLADVMKPGRASKTMVQFFEKFG